jgi:hypothetical protein
MAADGVLAPALLLARPPRVAAVGVVVGGHADADEVEKPMEREAQTPSTTLATKSAMLTSLRKRGVEDCPRSIT